jgi:hypothetical protein
VSRPTSGSRVWKAAWTKSKSSWAGLTVVFWKCAIIKGRRPTLAAGSVVVDGNELVERVAGSLSAEELNQVLLTELVVRGRVANLPDRPEVWVAIEISAVIDGSDVERAVQRAGLLRRAGVPALPAVAGDEVTEHAESAARNQGVVMLEDGSASFWDEALAAWPV